MISSPRLMAGGAGQNGAACYAGSGALAARNNSSPQRGELGTTAHHVSGGGVIAPPAKQLSMSRNPSSLRSPPALFSELDGRHRDSPPCAGAAAVDERFRSCRPTRAEPDLRPLRQAENGDAGGSVATVAVDDRGPSGGGSEQQWSGERSVDSSPKPRWAPNQHPDRRAFPPAAPNQYPSPTTQQPPPYSARSFGDPEAGQPFLVVSRVEGGIAQSPPTPPSPMTSARLFASGIYRRTLRPLVSRKTDSAKFVAYCMLWYSSSAITNNIGKQILNQFRYPVTLTYVQFGFVAGMCFLFSLAPRSMGGCSPSPSSASSGVPSSPAGRSGATKNYSFPARVSTSKLPTSTLRCPSRATVTATLPLALFQIGGHVFSTVAISRASVSFVHTIKALSPLFTVLIYRSLFRVSYSSKVYITLLPLTLGVMLACSFEFNVDPLGF
ncbi:MAG: hypothetical protein BJ554DRAFT_8299, partial [Olpidium bornovanus]